MSAPRPLLLAAAAWLAMVAGCGASPTPDEPAHPSGAPSAPSASAATAARAAALPEGPRLDYLSDAVRWVPASGEEVAGTPSGSYGRAGGLVRYGELAMAPDGTQALVTPSYNRLALVSLPSGKALWSQEADIDALAVSPDGKRFARSGDDGLAIFELATGERARAVTLDDAKEVRALVFSPDGKRLGLRAANDLVMVLEVETGRELGRFQGFDVGELAFSPDGRRLATLSSSTLRVWDIERRSVVFLDQQPGWSAFAFEPKGGGLLVGSTTGVLARVEPDASPRPAPAVPLARLPLGIRQLVPIAGARGSQVAVALEGQLGSLVDLGSGKELARFEAPSSSLLASSADGRTLAVYRSERTVLYRLPELAPLRPSPVHLGRVQAIAAGPSELFTGGTEGAVMAWSLGTGKLEARRFGFDAVTSLGAVPRAGDAGAAVAIGTAAGDLLLYDAALGRQLLRLHLGTGEVRMAVAPDGKQLAAGLSGDGSSSRAVLLDLGSLTVTATLEHVRFSAFAFTPELLVAGPDPIRVMRRSDGAELRAASAHSGSDPFAIGIVANRYVVAAQYGEYSTALWALGAEPAHDKPDLDEPFAFSPDGTLLACARSDALRILRTADARVEQTVPVPKLEGTEERDRIYALGFTPDGARVLSGLESGVAQVQPLRVAPRSAATVAPGAARDALVGLGDLGTVSHAIGPRDLTLVPNETPIESEPLSAYLAAFSPAGDALAVVTPHAIVMVDPAKGTRERHELYQNPHTLVAGAGRRFGLTGREHGSKILSLGAEPKDDPTDCRTACPLAGDAMLCTGYETTLWRGGNKVATLKDRGSPDAIVVSADGRLVAMSDGRQIRVLEIGKDSLQPVAAITAHLDRVRGLALSRDGKLVCSAGSGVVLVHEIRNGKLVALLEGQGTPVECAFSPNGSALASADNEGGIRVWQLATGKVVALLDAVEGLLALSFSPDGRALYTVAREGGLASWALR